MWWTIAVMLTILWLPGLLSGYTAGGVIHILLALALVGVLFRIIQGRRPA
ncbi:MAG: lmo0937 family membrane protein [Planctomycetes bacterium]|nr:lmo0937 family membrane protein [Planctomycetota bacterium]